MTSKLCLLPCATAQGIQLVSWKLRCCDGLRYRAGLPHPHQPHCKRASCEEYRERHDPGNNVEAAVRRSGQHGVAVLLYETLQHQRIAVTTLEASGELVAHAVRIGAADVVTLQQNLVAATHAHELMAEFAKACVSVSAHKAHGHHSNQRELGKAEFRILSFHFQCVRYFTGLNHHNQRARSADISKPVVL